MADQKLIKYATDQIVVGSDYGDARCLSCGSKLIAQYNCSECHAQFDGNESIFWKEGMRI